ncbi:MAG: hypothetical protein Q8M01_02765 [Rubrivivax sp.]|nr:hypothetical protein [Rubrivivax sp.]
MPADAPVSRRPAAPGGERGPLLAGALGEVCAVPRVSQGYKLLFGAVVLLVLVALSFHWFTPFSY